MSRSDAVLPAATSRLALAGAVAAGAVSGVAFTAAAMWRVRSRFGSGDATGGPADRTGMSGQAGRPDRPDSAYRASRAHRTRLSDRARRSDWLERAELADWSRTMAPAIFHLHATSARPPKAAESVSVLIPVRHDADTAMTAVTAALGQRGVDRLDVVVLDEGCPEATRAALRREFGDDPRVRILSSAPLPDGWSPRAHRGHQLAVAARGRVLLFAEACAPLGPDAAAAAAALLRGEGLDLAVLDTGRPRPIDAAKPRLVSGSGTGAGREAGTGPGMSTGTGPESKTTAGTGTGTGSGSRAENGTGTGTNTGSDGTGGADSRSTGASASRPSQADSAAGARRPAQAQTRAAAQPAPSSAAARRFQNSRFQSVRTHPGRFAVAVDAGAYWRLGGYRAAAADLDPLALLRTMRRASGRVAVADGRRVIPPASLVDPVVPDGGYGPGYYRGPGGPSGDDGTGVPTGSMTNRSPLVDITDTARRLLAALAPGRW